MSILTNLFSGGAAELVKGVGGVIDNLHTSKEEKLEAERKIKAHSLYYPKIKNLIKKEKDILLQESFLKDLNKELGKELRTNKYKIISIFLKASLKETKKRNLKRKQKIASEEYMKKSYSYLAVPEEKDILIDVESISVKETVDLIINLLKN